MAKQITVRCSPDIARVIIAALRWFVEKNYPRGADECSIAAREALLDLVDRFESELFPAGVSHYSHRVRAFVCEAVKGYLAREAQITGQNYVHRCEVVIRVCRGLDDGADFDTAGRLDAAGVVPPTAD